MIKLIKASNLHLEVQISAMSLVSLQPKDTSYIPRSQTRPLKLVIIELVY